MSLKAFIHGLNIYNLTKPQQVDDLIPPDPTPTNVANARLEQIRRNAADDYSTAQSDMLDDARKEAKQNRHAALSLAADRVALHRTIRYIERSLAAGMDPKEVMAQAQSVREREYLRASTDNSTHWQFRDGIKTMPTNADQVRKLLVDGYPVGQEAAKRTVDQGVAKRTPYKPSGPVRGNDPSV